MSCGTKIEGRFYSWSEREELADRLEQEGESRIAHSVRRQECLDSHDLWQAERALERQGQSRLFDYRETRCACRTEDEEESY